MRIITGSARGRKLKTLKEDTLDVRPTADSVKEAVFSAIQFNIEGKIIADLFAGTGQLGIEALSRGAKRAYFTDSSGASINVVHENLKLCGFEELAEIFTLSASAFLKKADVNFDIAFLDPPYGQDLINHTLPALAQKMNKGGIIICEHESDLRLKDIVENFIIYKTYKHGKKNITIYKEETHSG